MPSFHNGAVEISYLDEGDGAPVVLVHGFASNKDVNWVQPGWVQTLVRAGFRAIALDNRGHGQSSKLYDPADYRTDTMADDVRALLDHLSIEQADVLGYSMGARIAAFLALKHPQRTRSIILGGLGLHLVSGVGLPETIAVALEANSLDSVVSDPVGHMFRNFAEQTKSDLKALAACIRGSRQTLTKEQAASIRTLTLIAVGTKDTVAGSGPELAKLMPNARALDIPGRDHMLAVGDKVFKAGVLDFLENRK
jgi:pimeloyl-ACP methyl ester carboxylesterase